MMFGRHTHEKDKKMNLDKKNVRKDTQMKAIVYTKYGSPDVPELQEIQNLLSRKMSSGLLKPKYGIVT